MPARGPPKGPASSTRTTRRTHGESRTRQRNQQRFRYPLPRNVTPPYLPSKTDVASDPESDASSSLEQESNDAQLEAATLYRDLSRQVHRNHICPFSDPSRPNPRCSTFPKARTRKDAITNHLRAFQFDGYDEAHPKDDPIWKSDLVRRYYLVSEPPKLSTEQKKKRIKEHNRKNYIKRTQRQKENLDEWNSKYLSGELSAADMKKRLVGNARRDFLFKLDLQGRIEEKEAQLRQELVSGDASSITSNRALLASIDKLKRDLNSTNELTAAHGTTMSNMLKSVVGFWDSSRQSTTVDGPETPRLLEERRGWRWPTTPSIDAFYQIAAFLVKFDQTDNVRSTSRIREMKDRLHQYIKVQGPQCEGKTPWDDLESVFNQSVDLVRAAEVYIQYCEDDAAVWCASQDAIWKRALMAAKDVCMPTFVDKAPVEVMAQVDNIAFCLHQQVDVFAASEILTTQMEDLIQ